LGCGYDATFFWLCDLKSQQLGFEVEGFMSEKLCYVEVDYDQVVNRKIEIMNKHHDKLKKHVNLG